MDGRSGFCSKTRTFRSLRPPSRHLLPSESVPISAASYALSLLSDPLPPPTRPALVDAATGESLTFPELVSRVRNLASALRTEAPGVTAGRVALVLSPATLDVPVLYLALLSVGAVVSAANPLSSSAEISHQLAIAKPSVVFAAASVVDKVRAVNHQAAIIVIDSPTFLSFMSSSSCPTDITGGETRQSDTAVVLYSSGTTGVAKGVALTHRSLIAAIASVAGSISSSPEEVNLSAVPLFHIYGFFVTVLGVSLGETAVIMRRFDLEGVFRAVERHRVTKLSVAPPVVAAVARSSTELGHDLSSLRSVACGGAPLPRAAAEMFAARFPDVELLQGYGMTESAGFVSVMASREESKAASAYGSVGRLSSELEAKIVDPATGEAVGPGRQGELWLHGSILMKGYVGDKAATASAMDSEGWLRTGDLCYFDEKGFLFIVDRLKEVIKYKAYQVPPAELERILQSHPQVADVAVIPYPDEEAGQVPMAMVVRKPGSTLDEQQVIDYVAKLVSPYKKIRRVAFVESIPKSPTGKILRRELIGAVLSKL